MGLLWLEIKRRGMDGGWGRGTWLLNSHHPSLPSSTRLPSPSAPRSALRSPLAATPRHAHTSCSRADGWGGGDTRRGTLVQAGVSMQEALVSRRGEEEVEEEQGEGTSWRVLDFLFLISVMFVGLQASFPCGWMADIPASLKLTGRRARPRPSKTSRRSSSHGVH